MEKKNNNTIIYILFLIVGILIGIICMMLIQKNEDHKEKPREIKTEEKEEKAEEQEPEKKEEEKEETKEEYKKYHIVRKDGLWSKDFVDGKGKFTLKNKKTINFEIKDDKGDNSEEVLYVENNKLRSYAIIYKLGIMDNGLIVVDYGRDYDQVETHYRDYYDENYKIIKTIESVMYTPDILATEFHQMEYTGECRNDNQRIDNENSVTITSNREFIIKFIKEIKSDNCAGMV